MMKASRYRSNGDTSVEQDSVVILHPPPPVRLMGLTSELIGFCCISFCCSGCHFVLVSYIWDNHLRSST